MFSKTGARGAGFFMQRTRAVHSARQTVAVLSPRLTFFGYTIHNEGYFENRYGLAAGASCLLDDDPGLKGKK